MYMNKKLDKLYNDSLVIPFNDNSNFILFSDCHRGQGNSSDNFLPNQNIFYAALDYYYKRNYTYIEIGDGDELWENRYMDDIIDAHQDSLFLLSKFYKSNRLYMMYGNHDIVKKYKSFCKNKFCNHDDKSKKNPLTLFPDIVIRESLLLRHEQHIGEIFLIHGHQGDLINDTLWPLGRWLVRYIWRPMESIGFQAPTSKARSHKQRIKIESYLSDYANKKKSILIAGHTHRPVFSAPRDSLYFNDGSCVSSHSITGIEITKGSISLVKWSIWC
jgi:UDP-2,3-diacylglucosamine pyrophosphatase LpxH